MCYRQWDLQSRETVSVRERSRGNSKALVSPTANLDLRHIGTGSHEERRCLGMIRNSGLDVTSLRYPCSGVISANLTEGVGMGIGT